MDNPQDLLATRDTETVHTDVCQNLHCLGEISDSELILMIYSYRTGISDCSWM